MNLNTYLAGIQYNSELARGDPEMEELWKVRNDSDLTEAARRKKEEKLLPSLKDRWEDLLEKNGTLVAGARKAYLAMLPAAVQLKAFLQDAKRVNEIREGARGMGTDRLATLISQVALAKDLAAAFGLRLVVEELEDEKMRAELIARLDQIGPEGHEKRLGLLLAIQEAAAEFEVRGPDQAVDPVLKAPGKVMSLYRKARAVPTGVDGEEREISEDQAQRYIAWALAQDS